MNKYIYNIIILQNRNTGFVFWSGIACPNYNTRLNSLLPTPQNTKYVANTRGSKVNIKYQDCNPDSRHYNDPEINTRNNKSRTYEEDQNIHNSRNNNYNLNKHYINKTIT